MAEEPKPLFKPLRFLQTSDVLAGVLRAIYKADSQPRKVVINMSEMIVYKTFGRLLGEHMTIAQLSGSGNSVRLIVDKQTGKDIEEDIGVFLIAGFDDQARKGQKFDKAVGCGLVDSAISFTARYIVINMLGQDINFLDWLKSINPLEEEGVEQT